MDVKKLSLTKTTVILWNQKTLNLEKSLLQMKIGKNLNASTLLLHLFLSSTSMHSAITIPWKTFWEVSRSRFWKRVLGGSRS